MTSRTDVEKAKFSTTLCSLLAYTWWHDVDDKRYPRYRDSRWVDTVTHHEYSWRHLDRLTPHLAFSIVTLHHAWFVMRVLYCDTAPWQCTSLWCNPHHDTASSMSTHMICLHTWCVYKFHMSTHFFNLSVFLVKQPNLKFKPVCNYTPTLHVFSMAAPTVSVRAREQLIWACSSWNSQTWSSNWSATTHRLCMCFQMCHERDVGHIRMSHIWKSHVTYEWDVWCAWISHVTHTDESCHPHERVMSPIRTSHVTHTNESCHPYKWVMSPIRTSHVTHTNESCHI